MKKFLFYLSVIFLSLNSLFAYDNDDFNRARKGCNDLKNANLAGANLWGVRLGGCDLANANLAGAKLSGGDFSGANLINANLSGAKLQGTDFSGANLSEAILEGASLWGTKFSGADMQGAKIGVYWKSILSKQGVKNFTKINWIK